MPGVWGGTDSRLNVRIVKIPSRLLPTQLSNQLKQKKEGANFAPCS